MLRTGVLLLLREPTERLAALARAIDDWGYDYLWLADERFFRDVYAALTLCAVNTRQLHLGPCVTDPYSRHPALTAVSIATLDEISEGRAVLGFGAGLSGFRELGLEVDRPVVAMREAIAVIRGLLGGETVDADGEFVVFHRGRLDFVPPRSRIPVYIASQREGGLRLAGRVAEGAMMQGCVAEPILEFFRERVGEGVAKEGRQPSAIDLVARVNVAIADDPSAAKDLMRPSIVRHLLAECPEFPTFARAGLTVPNTLRERLLAMEYTHDPARVNALAGEVPDAFVDAVTLAGDAADVAAGVTRLARGGITQFIVYPVAPAGRIEPTLEAFQRDVMPAVRKAVA